jgi:hypothetical protein
MPDIEAEVIQELDNQIDRFKKIIETAGSEKRDKLKSIKVDEVHQEVPRNPEGKVDQEAWSKLGEDKQQGIHHRLSQVCDSLRAAAGLDGPTDPHHIMFDDYASNTAIIWLTIISFGLMFLLLGGVIWQWNYATDMDLARKIQEANPKLTAALKNLETAKKDVNAAQENYDTNKKDFETAKKKVEEAKAVRKEGQESAPGGQTEKAQEEAQKNLLLMTQKQGEAQKTLKETTTKQLEAQKEVAKAIKEIPTKGATESSILTMVILLGALGGTLHLVSSLFKYVGNRRFKRSWILYYLAMPLTGAGLAPIIYLLLRVGIVNPSGVTASGSSLPNLNLMAIYAFALLTGMFSRAATDKLAEIFGTMFKTASPPSKDALGSKKPPVDGAVGANKTP